MGALVARLAALVLLAAGARAAAQEAVPASAPRVAPLAAAGGFFAQHCVRCHGPERTKAGLRLDQLRWDAQREETQERWLEVLERLESGEMPPEEEPRPSRDEVEALTAAIRTAIGTLGEGARGPRVLRRLNRVQLRNTLRDLLGLDVRAEDPTGTFPPDDELEGFDTLGEGLVMSDFLLRQVLVAARRALDQATFEGPQPEPATFRMFAADPGRPHSFEANHVRAEHAPLYLFLNDERSPGDTRGQNLTTSRDGAPAKGWYDFRFELESRGRGNLPAALLEEVRPDWQQAHPEDLHRLEIYLSAPYGTSPYTGRRRVLVEALDLPDGERVTLERRLWLPRGWRVELAFGNAYAGHLADYLSAIGADAEVAALERLPKPEQLARMGTLTQEWIARADAPRIEVHAAEESGPHHASWPPPSHRAAWGDPARSPEENLRAFAERAFRRPVADEDLAPFLALAAGPDGPRRAREAILCSPRFLYLLEGEDALDDWALAARLSYFLWSTMPDERLRALAAEGRLREPEVLRAEAERLLDDPRSAELVEHFTWGWLHLQNALDMAPDPMRFPEYHRARLGPAMAGETRAFFADLLATDGPITRFLDADYAFVNADLARHYGLAPVASTTVFERVPLPPEQHRGGLLGQGAVLTTSANGVDTSPVVRGVWVLEHLLGAPPEPPPPGIPIPEPDARGELTIRQRFEKHRTAESCNECHRTIDPLGFALESFDAVGRWRDTYESGLAIDPAGRMPDGETFEDVRGLKRALLADLPRFGRHLTRELATYASGRLLRPGDHAALERLVTQAAAQGWHLRELVLDLVASPIFRER